jgi:site-specific recombinase XerD
MAKLRGRARGPLAPHAAAFGEALAGRGYAVRSAEAHLFLLAWLSRWLDQMRLDPGELGPVQVDQFLRWHHAEGHRFPKSVKGAMPLLVFLRGLGVVPEPPAPALDASEQLLERFHAYLASERGLAEGTIYNYVHAGRLFLRALERQGELNLGALRAADVDGFVALECRRRSIAAAKNLVSGLRSLLGFLYLEGITASSLSGAVPAVSGWAGGGLPRGVDAGSVRRLLAGCDRRTAKGARDFAILTVLARLGLRAGEVVALDLDDVDWPAGEVLVRGKAGRLERLPLPPDVGEALAGYLTGGRPGSDERALFLRVPAPHRRITPGAVSMIVRAGCRRAGLDPIATHRLRHTVASELLRRGAGLPEIGQLLRHRSAAATSIYAKADTAALRGLARPWPGSAA